MFVLNSPKVSDLTWLMQDIIRSVREDQIAILPKERVSITAQIDSLIEQTEGAEQYLHSDLNNALKLLERISIVVNLHRYAHLAIQINRARALINSLIANQDTKPSACTNLLAAYLSTHGIITNQAELYCGNKASITSAYQTGTLTLSEAIDAFEAIVACSNKLQISQLSRAC
ncbi:hypothetical protein GT360_18755 [Vibrio astriarenae]|uniref:Uncharacterized protein n=1 Tax=Vibrio astriarenae TaxID=1481923 RepID=A0A7Z2T7C8_9VIBR|nr:hypothetical protein [Vibrio astriarenae]QIA65573.1 hypothetical protein GT360_18755 [Vibrio astriarenae]